MAIRIDGGSTSFVSTITSSPSAARTVTIPDATITVAASDLAQTFTAAQTFNSGNLKLAGSTSGSATLNAPAIASTNTYTLPPDASTLGYRNIPISGSAKTSSYTLATTDVGEYIEIGTGGSRLGLGVVGLSVHLQNTVCCLRLEIQTIFGIVVQQLKLDGLLIQIQSAFTITEHI